MRAGNLNSPSQVTPCTAITDSEHHYKEIMEKQVTEALGLLHMLYTLLKRLLYTALKTYQCSFTKGCLNTKPNCIQVVNELTAFISVYYVIIKK